jgi:signal transduction histidine kinase
MAARLLMPTERAVLVGLAIGRCVALAWMTGVVAWSDDSLRRPWLAVTACVVGGVFALVALGAARSRQHTACHPALLVAESTYAVSLHLIDGAAYSPGHVFAVSQNLAVEWPLLVVLTVAVAGGPWRAAALGVVAGLTRLGGAWLNDFDSYSTKHFVSVASTCVQLSVAGFLGGRLAGRLRRVETEVAAQRARNEVARTLHDTVLQTLAVVERRLADAEPELAGLVRRADRDVRSYLFGHSDASSADDLPARLAEAIDEVRTRLDPLAEVRCTVNTVVDDHRLDPRQQSALVGAVSEAVANALEHAQPREVVVYAEADDSGHVFASVRDDGTGFETSTAVGVGLRHSIEGRMRDVGGRSEVQSRVGWGTEVRVWTRP